MSEGNRDRIIESEYGGMMGRADGMFGACTTAAMAAFGDALRSRDL